MMNFEQTKTIDDLINHIQTMPDNMQIEVFHFVDFLRIRNGIDNNSSKSGVKKVKRQPGTLKGEVIFADDFDEPLDDFKDYMY